MRDRQMEKQARERDRGSRDQRQTKEEDPGMDTGGREREGRGRREKRERWRGRDQRWRLRDTGEREKGRQRKTQRQKEGWKKEIGGESQTKWRERQGLGSGRLGGKGESREQLQSPAWHSLGEKGLVAHLSRPLPLAWSFLLGNSHSGAVLCLMSGPA